MSRGLGDVYKRQVQRMLKEIPDARCVPIDGTNHYSILFQPNPTRDDAVDNFLTELNK